MASEYIFRLGIVFKRVPVWWAVFSEAATLKDASGARNTFHIPMTWEDQSEL